MNLQLFYSIKLKIIYIKLLSNESKLNLNMLYLSIKMIHHIFLELFIHNLINLMNKIKIIILMVILYHINIIIVKYLKI